MVAIARRSPVVLFGAFLPLLGSFVHALPARSGDENCVHLTGYAGPTQSALGTTQARPAGGNGGQAAVGICTVDDARDNSSLPFKINADFVPVTGDDSLGFYCVYGAKASITGGVENNVCIYLFELTGGEVLVFGSGYGNISGANLFDAAYDMERVDQVIRSCMGKTPAQTPLRLLVPHGHGDHINPACNRELERLGYRIAEITFHPADFTAVNNMAWTTADRALFRILPAGTTCLQELTSYTSPLGKLWAFHRPGHTDGSIDLVIDTKNDVTNRFVVRGSQASSPCAPLSGQREVINAHGNVELLTVPPTLDDVTPLVGSSLGGTLLTLTGASFTAPGAGTPSVLVNGTPATEVIVMSDTSLTCKTPPGPPGELVEVALVTNNGMAVFPGTFFYNALPTLTSVLPTSGDWRGGTVAQVRGTGFVLSSGINEVFFGSKKATNLVVKSDTLLTCRVPSGTPGTTVTVLLRNPNGSASLAGAFSYSSDLVITAVDPPSAPALGGTSVLLTGTSFTGNGADPTVTFGGVAAGLVALLSDSSVLAVVPPGVPGTSVDVVLTNSVGSATFSGFRYHALPRITSVVPPAGREEGGTQVTLNGSGFFVDGAGTNLVRFGGAPALQVTVVDDTSLRCLTPPGIEGAVVNVTVTNQNGTAALAQAFAYTGPMEVTSLTPVSGIASGGTLVTILGSGFVDGPAGPNTVRFGSVAATQIVAVNNNTLTCRTPAGTPVSVVDLQVSNANGTVTLAGAYRYHALPTMTALTPNHGHAGGQTSVTISGSGFFIDSAGTNVVLVGGIPATGVLVQNNTSLVCNFPAGNPGTTVDVTLTNANGSATLPTSFRYHTRPVLTSLTPTSGGASLQPRITLTGSGFLNDQAGTPTITFGGLTASAVSVVSDLSVTCNAPVGVPGQTVDVVLTNARGSSTLTRAYRFHARPTLTTVTPATGTSRGGTQVTLTGSGFLVDSAGTNAVSFGGAPATQVTVVDDATLRCLTPIGVEGSAVGVTITNQNGTAAKPTGFTYTGPVEVSSLSPVSGTASGGTLVTITGSGFVDGPAGPNTVTFGGVAATQIVAVDNKTLTCRAPAGAPLAVVDLQVTNANGTITAPAAYRYHARPTLISLAPNNGHAVGQTAVTVSGTGFLVDSPGNNAIQVGGVAATGIQVLSNTQILCNFPAGTPGATVDVTLTNANGSAALPASFRYHTLPTLSSLSPTNGGASAQLRITLLGTGFLNDQAGTPAITFGGLAATSVSVVNDQTVRCNAPSGPAGQTVDVVLTNARGTASLPQSYRFHSRPSLTGVTPTVGSSQGGTQVTLTGSGFQSDGAGFNVVSFGSSFAGNVVVLSDTTAQCVTPPGVQDAAVDVVLSNSNGTTSLAGAFTYSISPPVVGGVTPASGPAHAPGSVQITGSGFTRNGAGTNTVRFGSTAASIVGVIDDARLSCQVPPGAPGTAVDVQVTNANGTNLLPSGFRYHALPALSAISPISGSAAGGTTMQLAGKGFLNDSPGANSVTFGGKPALNVTVVNDTLLTCSVPAGAGGETVEVRVSNANGQTGTRSFAYFAKPNLLTLAPASGPLLGGTRVTLTGTGFLNNSAGTNTVNFGRRGAANVVVQSDTQLDCDTPSGDAGYVNVTVINANGASTLENGFHYGKLPAAILSVQPADGTARGQTLVTLKGRGFTGGTSVNRVLFGTAQSSSVITVDDETILCLTAAGQSGTTVDVTLENGSKLATLANAFRYHAMPTLASVSPAQGKALEETRVTLTGTGFVADSAGACEVLFGGVRGREVQVHDDRRITCKVMGGGPGALLDVTVRNANGAATLADAFRVLGGPPSIESLTPRSGPFLGGTSVVFAGTGFSAGNARVTFGGVPALDVVVSSDTRLVCVAPPGTQGESVTVTLTTKNGQVSRMEAFTYEGIRPELTTIVPDHGPATGGTRVTLSGHDFLAAGAGLTAVSFDGIAATSVVVVNDGTVTCTTPVGLSGKSVAVRIQNENGVDLVLDGFRYHASPTLTAVTPAFGPAAGGTTVTLTGTGFSIDGPGPNQVLFGTQPATSVSVQSNTRLTCVTPAGASNSTVDVRVTNLNGSADLLGGFGYRIPPQIVAISPGRGSVAGGTALTITGSGFQNASSGINRVTIGGVAALDVVTLGDTSLTCKTPAASSGLADVTVTNDAGSDTEPSAFLYFVPPSLSAVSPASGPRAGGTQVTLTGRGFLEPGVGTTIVRFGGVQAVGMVVQSDTTIVCSTPPGTAGAQVDVTLANQNGAAALPGAYRFHAIPTLTSAAPAFGPAAGGTVVTLSGSGFSVDAPGPNQVLFGTQAAGSVTVLSNTRLTCVAPPGAASTTVDVRLTNLNGSAVLAGGFVYGIPPQIAAVSPARGSIAGGTALTITGSGFQNASSGINRVTIGGLPALDVVTIGDTSLTCKTPAASAGLADVTVTNDAGSDTEPSAFLYFVPPSLSAVSPAVGPARGGTQVTLTGRGFLEPGVGTTFVRFGGVAAVGVVVQSDTTLVCSTPAGAAGAQVDVTLANQNGAAALVGAFRYHAVPVLTSVTPAHGPQGGLPVTLVGSGFLNNDAGPDTVTFGATAATQVVVVDDTTLTCRAPAGAAGASVDVRLTNANGSSTLPAAFRYHREPTLASVAPLRGPSAGGTTLTLTGTGFQVDDAGTMQVIIGGFGASNVAVLNDTTLTCQTPGGFPDARVNVTVANANGQSTLVDAFRYNPTPTLTAIAPARGPAAGGTTVTLTGSGFVLANPGPNAVLFGGVPATAVNVVNDTTLLCTTPPGTVGASVDVNVRNANGSATLVAAFRYAPLPALTSLAPGHGPAAGGTQVTLTGSNFADVAAGVTTVRFGGVWATGVLVVDDQHVQCTAPAGVAGSTVNVQLQNDNGQSTLAAAFRYHALPGLTAVQPARGSSVQDTPVTLTGTGFLADAAGANTVLFGAVPALGVSVVNDTTITCVVAPQAAGSVVGVSVANQNGSSVLAAGFAFDAPAPPTLAGLQPQAGLPTGGTTVTLTGSGFTAFAAGPNTVTFGGASATSVVALDDATIQCQTPPGTPGATVDVALSNQYGSALLSAAFKYTSLAPTVTSVSPASGPAAGGGTVTLTGAGFLDNGAGTNTVTFAGIPATLVSVQSDTTLTCRVPAGTAGTQVTVALANANGAGQLAAGYRYHALPTITSASPTGGTSLGGTLVTVRGTGFLNDEAGTITVKFADRFATSVGVFEDGRLTCRAPSGTAGASITLTLTSANGVAEFAGGYRYNQKPTVTAVSPSSGPAQGGNKVTVTGTGFLSDGASQNAVTFGSIQATNVVVRNNTTIECIVPPGTSGLSVQVTVNNVNGAGSLPNGYRYHARPRLTSLTPASGTQAGGTLVTVRGTGFQVDNPGTNRISFGGVQATAVTVVDDTTLTCVTPASAAPGLVDVVLNNNNGASSLQDAFSYSAPLVVAALPGKGTTQGSTSVTLMGSGFVPGTTTVLFGQDPALDVTVIDEQTLECLTPPGPAGAWVDVAVTTPGGEACLPLGFLYVAPPTLTSIEPPTGLPQGGTMVVLTGSGFLDHEAGENLVTFGGRAAPSVSVLDDQHLAAEVPSGDVLTEADVVVRNDNGMARLPRGFRWQMLLATDVNGDGRGDLILGSPGDDTLARDAGAVRVFLGTALPGADRSSAGADLLFLPEEVASAFGMPVAAGDLDGDGDAELVIGAPFDDENAADAGAVSVFSGPLASSPTALSLGQAAARLGGSSASERFGTALRLCDVDRNGVLDLLVGALGGNGAVHVHLGGAQGLGTEAALVIAGSAANERFGYSLAAGDLDGDGWADLAVGAPNMPPGGSRMGAVRVYRGGPALFGATPWLTFTGQELDEGFATDLATGDVSADGFEDLLVGSPWTSRSGTQSGAIFTFFGGSAFAGGSASTAQAILAGEGPGALFGFALATGDVDGDGLADLLSGAPKQGLDGRAYLFRGGQGFADTGAGEADVVLQAEIGSRGEFGRKVALIDVDGDGREDMVVTAPRLDASGVDTGRVYVFGASTTALRQAENDDATLTGSATGEELGRATTGD